MQQRVDEFNQEFWTRNNSMFLQAKAEYEEQCKNGLFSEETKGKLNVWMMMIVKQRGEEVTPEALSIFYKDFLDAAYERHMEYNRQWWKLNIGMLYPGFKATMRRLFQSKKTHDSLHQRGTNFWEKSFESWLLLKIGAQLTRHLLQDLVDSASLHVLFDQTADSLEFLVFDVLDQLEQHGFGCGNGSSGRSHTLWERI